MKLPILVYHKIDRIPRGARFPKNYVTPEQFDAQLAFLARRGYRTISFTDYLAYRRGDDRLPRRPILITFDDGYRSTREIALPLLAQRGFTATIFLVASFMGKSNAWDADEIQEPLLDIADIQAMQAAGIGFESHTATHARLTRLPAHTAIQEMRSSRQQLEAILGRPVTVICYPYGEHTDETRRLAAEAGYQAGVIVRRRMNADSTDLFALRRIPVTCETTLGRFAWDLFRLRWFHGS